MPDGIGEVESRRQPTEDVNTPTLFLGGIAVAALGVLSLEGASLGIETRRPEDLALEDCLTHGVVVEEVEVTIGITKPKRLVLECEGDRLPAIFKHVDEVTRGRTRFDSGRSEINFTDSYRYERAAYLLDRELGINRVPVAVIRQVEGRDGALVQWLENASMEAQLGRQLTTQERIELAGQKSTMHLFDALILNTDRRPENWLVGTDDLTLYLIDHSRAFRLQRELPEDFLRRPVRIPRELVAELENLNENDLTDLLEGLIDKAQIRALLVRRDLILQKVRQDLEAYGESVVFSE